MKKSRKKARTGNPAKRRRCEGVEDGGQRGWARWVGRDISGRKGQTFAHIRKVAADWDGAGPIRVIRT